jgi:hypothetical protein
MTSAWDPYEQPVDVATVAGRRTPGLCEIENAGSPRQWDERRGYGVSGATLVYRGLRLASFTMKLRLYTEADWKAWHEFAPTIARPPTGERAQALDVVHPILEEVGIRSAVVEDVLAPRQTADGEWTIEVRWKEFRRPVVTATAVTDSASSTVVESNAALAREHQLDQLSREISRRSALGTL